MPNMPKNIAVLNEANEIVNITLARDDYEPQQNEIVYADGVVVMIGGTYDEGREAFIPPKPFDSWILNDETLLWEAPIPYPNDGLVYSWDEVSGDWIEVVEPSA